MVTACSGGGPDESTPAGPIASATSDTAVRPTVSSTAAPERERATTPPATSPSTSPSTSASTAAVATTAPPTSATSPRPARCGNVDTFDEPVELRLWHSLGGDAAGWFDALIDEFEREHRNITIELEIPEGGWPSGVELLGAMAVDQRPDLILASELTARLQADSGAFVPVEECAGFATPARFTDLHPVIDTTYRIDGTLWAAPYNVSSPVLMYDGNLWRRAGLDPDDPPSTIDELEVAIRQLRDSDEAETGIVLYDRSAMWLVTVPASQRERLLVEPANGHEGLSIDRVAVASPDAVDTLERFRRLHREGYVDWIGLNQSNQEDLVALVTPTGLSGMTLHTSASLGDIYRLQDNGDLKDIEVRAAPFPGPGQGAPVGGGAWWLLDRGDPTRIEASWVFIDWLTSPERVAELAAYTGYVPTTPQAADHPVIRQAWDDRPAMRAAYDQVVAAVGSPGGASLQVGPLVETSRELEIAAARAISEQLDPSETLAAAERSIQIYLDLYREVHGDG